MAKHIFDPFYTGDASRGTHGSGLGLSIARTIVEMHRGTIELLPRDGEWKTIFRITLPIID
jgi:two-component system OmpR family sensor kinase